MYLGGPTRGDRLPQSLLTAVNPPGKEGFDGRPLLLPARRCPPIGGHRRAGWRRGRPSNPSLPGGLTAVKRDCGNLSPLVGPPRYILLLGAADDHPPRSRRLLRLRRAAGRPLAPRAFGDRRRPDEPGGRVRGELRGEALR